MIRKLVLCSFIVMAGSLGTLSNVHAVPTTTQSAPAAEAKGDPRSLELNEKGVAALQSNDTARAEGLFRQALEADTKNLSAAFNLAGALITNKKMDDAIALLTSYTSQYQQDPGLYSRLGDAYFANKNLKEAAKSYEQAFKLDPSYPRLPHRLGSVYGLMNNAKDAEKMMRLAVEQDPNDVKSMSSLSSLLLADSKVEESIEFAKRALQLKPTSDAYITLGAAYEQKKDLKNALIAFQRARDLGEKSKELSDRIDVLSKQVS